MIKIGINGMGRLGKIILRLIQGEKNAEVTVVNHPMVDGGYLENYLRYDTIYGRFPGRIEEKEDIIIIGNSKIRLHSEDNITENIWQDCDVLIDTAGKTSKKDYEKILMQGVKLVITTGSEGEMFYYKISESTSNIISYATAEGGAAAIIGKVINDNFGIENGIITNLSAYDECSSAVESYNCEKWRNGRTAGNSVIPAVCGGAQTAGILVPALKNKFSGIALRVPVRAVSVINMVVNLKKGATYEEVKNAFKKCADGELSDILGVTSDSVVSEDFIGCPLGTVVDIRAGIMHGEKMLKITGFYDGIYSVGRGIVKLAVTER